MNSQFVYAGMCATVCHFPIDRYVITSLAVCKSIADAIVISVAFAESLIMARPVISSLP